MTVLSESIHIHHNGYSKNTAASEKKLSKSHRQRLRKRQRTVLAAQDLEVQPLQSRDLRLSAESAKTLEEHIAFPEVVEGVDTWLSDADANVPIVNAYIAAVLLNYLEGKKLVEPD